MMTSAGRLVLGDDSQHVRTKLGEVHEADQRCLCHK